MVQLFFRTCISGIYQLLNNSITRHAICDHVMPDAQTRFCYKSAAYPSTLARSVICVILLVVLHHEPLPFFPKFRAAAERPSLPLPHSCVLVYRRPHCSKSAQGPPQHAARVALYFATCINNSGEAQAEVVGRRSMAI